MALISQVGGSTGFSAYNESSSTSTHPIPVPTAIGGVNLAAGDYLVGLVQIASNVMYVTYGSGVDLGLSAVATSDRTTSRSYLIVKKLASGDIGGTATVLTKNVSDNTTAVIKLAAGFVAFRNVDQTTALDVAVAYLVGGYASTTTPLTSDTADATKYGVKAVQILGGSRSSTGLPTSFTVPDSSNFTLAGSSSTPGTLALSSVAIATQNGVLSAANDIGADSWTLDSALIAHTFTVLLRPATVDYNLSVSDPIGITDTGIQQVIDRDQTITDPVGVTDAVSAAASTPRTVSDLVGITDTANGAAGLIRSVSDPLGIIDATGKDVGYSPAATADPAGITDAVTAAVAYARTITDGVAVTDAQSPSLAGGAGQTVGDPIAVSDTVGVSADWVRATGDTLGITDVASASYDYVRILADSFSLTDAVTAGFDYLTVIADTVGIPDEVGVGVDYVITVDDFVAGSDDPSAPIGALVTVDDIIGVDDNVTYSIVQITIDGTARLETNRPRASTSMIWSGESSPKWVRYTAYGNVDLRAAIIRVALSSYDSPPTSWPAAINVDRAAAGSGVIRAAIGDWTLRPNGTYWVWIYVELPAGESTVVDIALASNQSVTLSAPT